MKKRTKPTSKKKIDADDKKSFAKNFNKTAPAAIRKIIAKNAAGKTN